MNKKKIIGIIIVSIILIGLIIFASTKKFDDSHLRKEGIRVRVENRPIFVSVYDEGVNGCTTNEGDITYCEIILPVKDKEAKLVFESKDFTQTGYPTSAIATINGKEFYKENNLNIETNGYQDYRAFQFLHVIDDVIVYAFSKGTSSRVTTLYAIDLDGNILLDDYEIDTDDMAIEEYLENFITYEDNKIKIMASRIINDSLYRGETICNANKNAVVEAEYTYTYKNGKFSKKQTNTINAQKYIENHSIVCPSN